VFDSGYGSSTPLTSRLKRRRVEVEFQEQEEAEEDEQEEAEEDEQEKAEEDEQEEVNISIDSNVCSYILYIFINIKIFRHCLRRKSRTCLVNMEHPML
jgi:hypothetical protein